MASDLVAYHYRHSAFCNIVHTPLRGFSATPDTPDPTTFFTLLEGNDPAHIRQHWLFIHSANSLPNPIEQMSEVMDIIGSAKLTVNSYDKNIVTWAARMLADAPSKSITVDMLYEMRFRPQATSLFFPGPTDFQSPALAELQKNGFDIKESPDWFGVFKPGERSIVTLGGEKVFIVIDRATEEKAAYITLLVDPKGSDRVYVSSLETFPPWRMKGLAKRLIEHVHILHANGHFSRIKGPSRGEMWLTVFCENFGAVGMYHRLGYRVNRCLWAVGCRSTS